MSDPMGYGDPFIEWGEVNDYGDAEREPDELGMVWEPAPVRPATIQIIGQSGRVLVVLREEDGRMVADYDPADMDEAARVWWDTLAQAYGVGR